MTTEEIQALQQTAEVLTDKPVTIEIDVPAKSRWHKLLQRWKLKPAKKVYELKPLRLGPIIRISEILNEMQIESVNENNVIEKTYQMAAEHGEKLMDCIAIALHNSESEPPAQIKQLLRSCTAKEIAAMCNYTVAKVDVANFIKSIALIKGVNVLVLPNANATSASSNEASL